MREQRVVLCMHRDEVPLTLDSPLGSTSLNQRIYQPLLDLLADYHPRTLGNRTGTTPARHPARTGAPGGDGADA
jgi:hypothetical protein